MINIPNYSKWIKGCTMAKLVDTFSDNCLVSYVQYEMPGVIANRDFVTFGIRYPIADGWKIYITACNHPDCPELEDYVRGRALCLLY